MKSLSSIRGLASRVTVSPLTVSVTGTFGSDEETGIGFFSTVFATP